MAKSNSVGIATASLAAIGVASLVVGREPDSGRRQGGPPPPAARMIGDRRLPGAQETGAPGPTCAALPEARPQDANDAECRKSLVEFFERYGLCEAKPDTQALIASIPEPLESRLNHASDQALGALLTAAEEGGRSFVDAWLPWVRDRRAAQDARAGLNFEYRPGQDAMQIRAPPDLPGCHDRWPGVVHVARYHEGDDAAKSAGVLLIMGELPTAGVRKAVLERAVAIAARIDSSADHRLRLIGPMFSGSAGSLRDLLTAALAKEPSVAGVDLWTGSATNYDNKRLLKGPKLTFHATVAPDGAVLDAFYLFLKNQGYTTERPGGLMPNVAVLAEADTAYGQGAFGSSGLKPRYQIRFPIHISDVRSAWEKESSTLRDAKSEPVPAPQQAVRVDLQERVSDARDALPTFSSVTPAYDERALTSALTMLRENSVDVVGILATDTRDRLFLAEAIKRSAPDAQLFTLEADMLFTHPDYAHALRGALVVSSYPLVTSNQFWANRVRTNEPQWRNQFGTSMSEGIYNAALLAFHAARHGADKGYCESELRLAEYHWPLFPGVGQATLQAGSPPLWVTVIGQNGAWPVAILPLPGGKDDAYLHDLVRCGQEQNASVATPAVPQASPVATSRVPFQAAALQTPALEPLHSVSFFFVLLCAAVVAFCAFIALAHTGSVTFKHGGILQPLSVLQPDWGGGHGRQRVAQNSMELMLFLLLGLTIWLGAIAVAPIEFRARLSQELLGGLLPADRWQELRAVAATVTIATCAGVLAFLFAQGLPSKQLRWRAVSASIAAVAISVFASGPLLRWAAGELFIDGQGIGVSRYWRIIHPWSWVSPLTPTLFLLAVGLLALTNMLRLIFIDRRMSEGLLAPAAEGERDAAPGNFWDSLHGFATGTTLARGLRDLAAYGWTATAILLLSGWCVLNVHGLLDGRPWGLEILRLLMGIAVFVCLTGLRHMWSVWRMTKRWLTVSGCVQLKPAFESIREEAGGLVGEGTAMMVPDPTALRRLGEMFTETGAGTVADAYSVFRKRTGRYRVGPAERFLAMRYALLIGCAVSRLRGIWFRVSFMAVLFVASISLYPVHPHKELMVLSWLLVSTVVSVTVVVFVQMNRNQVLSTLAGTKPNEVTWTSDFVQKLLTVAGIPLLGVVAAQFPQVARVLGSLLGPIFRGSQ